ncbi:MAG TPA: hypothetical protein VMU24_14095, partial [Candidatus Acidoferrales bacterium]|nr:hypothetical protein [Candidatus Acidoferrales bacterium]
MFKSRDHRYYYWSAIRLDSRPAQSKSGIIKPCPDDPNCIQWDDPEAIWVDPSPAANLYMWSNLPALLLTIA